MSNSDIFSGLRDECNQLRDEVIALRAERDKLKGEKIAVEDVLNAEGVPELHPKTGQPMHIADRVGLAFLCGGQDDPMLKERDQLKAQLAEKEVGAAAIRGLAERICERLDGTGDPSDQALLIHARQVLASNAGLKTTERLQRELELYHQRGDV